MCFVRYHEFMSHEGLPECIGHKTFLYRGSYRTVSVHGSFGKMLAYKSVYPLEPPGEPLNLLIPEPQIDELHCNLGGGKSIGIKKKKKKTVRF